MAKKWFKIRVNGTVVRVISGVDILGFLPYVCICRLEAVIFLSSVCEETRFTKEKAHAPGVFDTRAQWEDRRGRGGGAGSESDLFWRL